MDDGRMSLMQHLEELRKRIVRAFVAWFVAFMVCYTYAEQMYLLISRPLRDALPAGHQAGLPDRHRTVLRLSEDRRLRRPAGRPAGHLLAAMGIHRPGAVRPRETLCHPLRGAQLGVLHRRHRLRLHRRLPADVRLSGPGRHRRRRGGADALHGQLPLPGRADAAGLRHHLRVADRDLLPRPHGGGRLCTCWPATASTPC